MKSFAFIESLWIFRHGLCSRIRNISYRRQSNLPEHFLRMWKVGEDLKHQEIKPALINEQSVVYKFECGWCDASYVGYTRRHLYQRIDEHKRSGSIFNHTQSQHQSRTITSNMFHILKKYSGKFDCLLYEMFLIREHKPCLNIQSDSIKAKLFT